jgi:hypothetical protein
LVGVLGQHDALDLALAARVEQAELDLLRVGAEQREVDAAAVERGAQGVRRARPDPGTAGDVQHPMFS